MCVCTCVCVCVYVCVCVPYHAADWRTIVVPSNAATNTTTRFINGTTNTTNPTVNDVPLWSTWVEAASFTVVIPRTNLIVGQQYLTTLLFVEPW